MTDDIDKRINRQCVGMLHGEEGDIYLAWVLGLSLGISVSRVYLVRHTFLLANNVSDIQPRQARLRYLQHSTCVQWPYCTEGTLLV